MKNKLDNNFFKYACTNCGICTLVLKENFIFDESGLKYSQDISTQNFKKLKNFVLVLVLIIKKNWTQLF